MIVLRNQSLNLARHTDTQSRKCCVRYVFVCVDLNFLIKFPTPQMCCECSATAAGNRQFCIDAADSRCRSGVGNLQLEQQHHHHQHQQKQHNFHQPEHHECHHQTTTTTPSKACNVVDASCLGVVTTEKPMPCNVCPQSVICVSPAKCSLKSTFVSASPNTTRDLIRNLIFFGANHLSTLNCHSTIYKFVFCLAILLSNLYDVQSSKFGRSFV